MAPLPPPLGAAYALSQLELLIEKYYHKLGKGWKYRKSSFNRENISQLGSSTL